MDALNSYNHDSTDLLSTFRYWVKRLHFKGISIEILWSPSHINLDKLHDVAAVPSKVVAQKDSAEEDISVAILHVSNILKKKNNNNF